VWTHELAPPRGSRGTCSITADVDRLGEPAQTTTGAADGEGALGVGWMADGTIVYSSRATGNPDLWSLDPRTGTRRQLTSDPADDSRPSISPDGRAIAFVSNRQSGHRIWVMHADGTDARPVSSGPADELPFWTPDSGTIVFLSGTDVRQVNADGSGERSLRDRWPARAGEPAKTFIPRAVSAQGLVAGFEETDPQRGGGWRLAFAPLDASAPPKLLEPTFASATGPPIEWAPNGKAIDVVRGPAGGLWRFPIDGRPGSPLTAFTGNAVMRAFAWSASGRLLFSRGENKTDLVLFRRGGRR
jgi:dipeptidyl aminopeptidase/acylaminoacyl peptidase